jgi:hypothetical protein
LHSPEEEDDDNGDVHEQEATSEDPKQERTFRYDHYF